MFFGRIITGPRPLIVKGAGQRLIPGIGEYLWKSTFPKGSSHGKGIQKKFRAITG
jgi:hypothetical protein